MERNLNSASNSRPDTKVFSKLDKLSRWVETQESKSRRQNIVIKGLSTTKPAEEIPSFLETTFSIPRDDCKLIIQEGKDKDRYIVQLGNPEYKKKIMRTKKNALNNTDIFIDNDLTPIEKEEAFEIRKKLREERKKGNKPVVKANKLIMDGKTLQWDRNAKIWKEKKNEPPEGVIPQTPRNNNSKN